MRARGSEGVGHGARTPGQWRATEQNQTDLICLGLFTRGEERGRRDRIGKGERERGEGSFFVTIVVIVVATKRSRQVGMSGAFPSDRTSEGATSGMKQIGRIAAASSIHSLVKEWVSVAHVAKFKKPLLLVVQLHWITDI